MFKKILLSGFMSLTLTMGAIQLMASVGGDCSAAQLSCCPDRGRAELIHCQNMWNGDVFCAYDDDEVVDVTSCAGGSTGGSNGNGSETGESGPE